MTSPRLEVRATSDGKVVELRRPDASPDNFWARIRDEFPDGGRNTASRISIPAERFLLNRYIIKAVCKRYTVGLDVDEPTLRLLQAAEAERQRLTDILDSNPTVTAAEVHSGLDGTRFARTLTDFQVRDLRTLLAVPHGANFSVPGAGKTTTTYALYESERAAGRVDQMLVVGPLSSFDAWEGEAQDCFHDPPVIYRYENEYIPAEAEVVLIGYQRLIGHYERVARWVSSARTHVVLDEAHRMKKGREGAWGSACLDLAYIAARRDILSGTPAPQSPADLEVLMDYLWPTQGRRLIPDEAHQVDPPPHVTADIARRIESLFVRTSKREMHLPPVSHQAELVKLSGLHREIYDALRDRYSSLFEVQRRDRLALVSMGKVVMYMLEAATNPALLVAGGSEHDPIDFRHPPLDIPTDSELFDLLREYPAYETPAKFLRLAKMVTDNAGQGRKTLVWTNFVRNLTTLKRELKGLNPALIHGGVPMTAPEGEVSRERELDRFRNDPDCWVLLANPASIGEGVSLHRACHDAIYVDRTFNAGQYLQSVDRIHRLGLDPDVATRIRFLITEDTIDEVVDSRVRTKAATLGRLLDDPDIVTMALPDEEDYGPAIETDDDLTALLEHLKHGGSHHERR